MTDEERKLLQATSDRLLRAAAAMERLVKNLEDREARDMTIGHELRLGISHIKNALNVRDELREITASHPLYKPEVDKPHVAISMLAMFATLPPWLQALIILSVLFGAITIGTLIGISWINK